MADRSEERLRGYVVISKTLVDAKKYEGCKVIPHGDVYPAVYRQVYGPASKRDCEKWVNSNCSRSAAS
ncbi:MAG TPA: hypothetical protein VF586_02620 [Pyrinomonadaceae bacterium]|jgi:hypothetical protein